MKTKRVAGGETATYVAVLEPGEEAFGDIAVGPGGDGGGDGQPQPHLHAVLGLADGTTRGGHLLEGMVWPTLEVIVREAPAELRKTHRPEVGLALIDLDR